MTADILGMEDLLAKQSAVDEAGRQWARQMADQMLATFTPDALRPSAPASEQAEEPTLWQQLEDICRE